MLYAIGNMKLFTNKKNPTTKVTELKPTPPVKDNENLKPEISNVPSQSKPIDKKRILAAICLVLIILGAGFLYSLNKKPTDNLNSGLANEPVPAESTIGSVFCVKVGFESIQCEQLDTKEVRKYTLPESIRYHSGLLASPDGSKYIVTLFNDDDTKDILVYNANLEQLASLPSKTISEHNLSEHDLYWLDQDTLTYLTTDNYLDGNTVLNSFDITSGEEKVLIELEADIDRVMPSGDENYIYGIQSDVDEAQNAVVRKLVMIDVASKKIVDVENNLEWHDEDSILYSQITGRFYVNKLLQEVQKNNLEIYSVDKLSPAPTLVKVAQLNDAKAQGTVAYTTVASKKGIFANEGLSGMKYPLRFITESGEVTELSLAVGNWGGYIFLSLQDFPAFDQAETSAVVTSDLFKPSDDVPEKIVAYIERLITDHVNCEKGEYASYQVQNFDKDKQFSLAQAGCGVGGGTKYFKADGNTYIEFASSWEGLSCEDRDEKGISKVVAPYCRMPGDGL